MSALVKIIKNPFDTNIEENVIKVKAKTCIKDIQGVDQNNLVAYVNGEHVNNDYILKNGDVCVIRQYPSAVTAGAIVTGIAITTASLIVGEAISYGVSGKSIGQNIKEGLQNWLLPKTDGATNQDREKVETLPSVSGSKNQSAFGKVVPLILGKTMFTPYTECKTAYNTISGDDGCNQMYHCLYIIGQKDLQIEDVSMGLEVLASNSNHKTNELLDITSTKFPYETIDPETQQVIPEKSYYTQLELQCGENEVSIFDQKVIQENHSTEITNVNGDNTPFYAYSSQYAQRVELEFTFSGLVGYNSDGTKKDATTEITVEYSFDGGQTWHWGGDPNGNCKFDFSQATISHSYDPTTHKITFSGQLPKTLRYCLVHTPDYEDMEDCLAQTITYQIKRVNAQSEDANVIDKIYLTAVRTWCYDRKASEIAGEYVAQVPMIEKVRNKTTRLGFSIKVDSNVQRDFDKINVIATSKARIYETGEGWTKELYPTRNPVALTLYAMTGDFRESYAYPVIVPEEGDYIECDQIDLEDFGEKYDICEQIKFTEAEEQYQKRYYCDGVVLNPTKTVDLVNSILKCCRSYIVIKGKKYGIFMDKAQDYPLLVLNNNNLLSLTYSKNFDEIPDGQRVKHISSINFYQQNTFDVYPIGTTVTGDEKLVNVEYPFIVDQYHAQAMSLYEQACLKLRPETIQAKVTGEGGLAEIGSLIPIQSDVVLVGIGDGAEIIDLVTSGNTITGIITDGKFAVTDITKEYGVVINVVGNVDNFGVEKLLKRKLASFSAVGEYSTLMFDEPIGMNATYKPEEGCIVSFGLYENEVLDMLCVGKNENEDNTYDLTLVPYDENIYLADEGAIPDFDPKTTPPQESGIPVNYGERTVPVSKFDVIDLISESKDMSTPPVPASISAVAKRDYIAVSWQATDDIIGYTEVQLSKDGGTSWTTVERAKANNYKYYFTRTGTGADGYPEANKFGSNGDYKFRLRNVSVNGVESSWVTQTVDASSYGTWIPATPTFINKTPDEGGITFDWAAATSSISGKELYGTPVYTITTYRGNGASRTDTTKETKFIYQFHRASEGYPEVTGTQDYLGLSDYTFSLTISNESGNTATLSPRHFSAYELSLYGTWIPATVNVYTGFSNYADRYGVNVRWQPVGGYNGKTLYGSVLYEVSRQYEDSGTRYERGNFVTDATSCVSLWKRSGLNSDGYPEKSTTQGVPVTTQIVNQNVITITPKNAVCEREGSPIESYVSETEYLTWIPHALSGNYYPKWNISKRCATISFVAQNDVYGNLKYGFLISRVATDNNQFYTPDLETDCYSDIDSYKIPTRIDALEVDGMFKQNLPLLGQDMMSVQVDRYDVDTRGGTTDPEHKAIAREYYICDQDGEDAFDLKYGDEIDWDDITTTAQTYSWVLAGGTQTDYTTRYVTVKKIDSPLPDATEYKYKIYVKNADSGAQSSDIEILVTPDANSVSDLVDKAITVNKLDDQCVTTEKIATGAITAEQIAVTNLLAKGATAGTMKAEGIMADGSGFWVGDNKTMRYDYKNPDTGTDETYLAQSGEFFVGNNPNHESDPTPKDEFIHFKPASGTSPSQFWIAIKNIIFQTLQTIVTGIFRVKNSKSDTDANAFLTVNPTASADSGTPAQTIDVKNGDLRILDGANVNGGISRTGNVFGTGVSIRVDSTHPLFELDTVLDRFKMYRDLDLFAKMIDMSESSTTQTPFLRINAYGSTYRTCPAKTLLVNNGTIRAKSTANGSSCSISMTPERINFSTFGGCDASLDVDTYGLTNNVFLLELKKGTNANSTIIKADSFIGNLAGNADTATSCTTGVFGRLGGANQTTSTTIAGLIGEVTGANNGGGLCGGSITVAAADHNVPAGWYNFLYIPHRTGIGGGDNYLYGTLFLTPMTSNSESIYVIHYVSGTIYNALRFRCDYVASAGTASSCSGNAATADVASSCSGNAATATTATTANRDSGGAWISARDNCVARQLKQTQTAGNSWNPVIGVKTWAGHWSMGTVGGETLCLSYDTDYNYNRGNNSSSVINFPTAGTGGTIALTSSDITGNAATATTANKIRVGEPASKSNGDIWIQ